MKAVMRASGLYSFYFFAAGFLWGADASHNVVQGDTMWDLAGRYYKDPFQWPRIAQANPGVKDPHWIYPGGVLVIPGYAAPAPPPPVQAVAATPVEPPAETVESTPEPEPPSQPIAPAPLPPGFVEVRDGLSAYMPEGQTGQGPSLKRYAVPEDYRWAGEIDPPQGDTYLAGSGVETVVRLGSKVPAKRGDTLRVFRKTAPIEAERGSDLQYVQGIGRVRLEEALPRRSWKAVVIDSAEVVQPGDLVVKE